MIHQISNELCLFLFRRLLSKTKSYAHTQYVRSFIVHKIFVYSNHNRLDFFLSSLRFLTILEDEYSKSQTRTCRSYHQQQWHEKSIEYISNVDEKRLQSSSYQ